MDQCLKALHTIAAIKFTKKMLKAQPRMSKSNAKSIRKDYNIFTLSLNDLHFTDLENSKNVIMLGIQQ